MLVLSRKKGESVVVNGNITIVVVDVRGDKARIGIEAPDDVAVYRSEILTKNASTSASEGEAEKTSRQEKNAVETSRRAKAKNGRGTRKKSVEPSGENAVQTLYLSSEGEAYRRSDAGEGERETDEAINDVK